MAVTLAQFYAACPGVVLSRDIDTAIAALPATSSAAAIRAAVLPLMPEGNPPQYTRGAPPAMPAVMPNASPLFAAALPPQPVMLIPIDGDPAHGTVATFARGLKRFQDSNPCPSDDWSIERDGDNPPAGGW